MSGPGKYLQPRRIAVLPNNQTKQTKQTKQNKQTKQTKQIISAFILYLTLSFLSIIFYMQSS